MKLPLRPGIVALLLLPACTRANPDFSPGLEDGLVVDRDTTSDRDPVTRVDAVRLDVRPSRDQLAPPPGKPHGVDVLFVVDNSAGMAPAQKVLAQSLSALTDALEALPSPSLRVGVTSTDAGVGSFANVSCTASGDAGKLLLRSGCPKPPGGAHWIAAEGKQSNVGAPLRDAVSCMVQIGDQGCGFEQPLEAMRLALSGNPGFLRSDAALAVVIVANEDDCSAKSQTLFDPEDATLGPYTSYRCFQNGVVCQGTKPPFAATLLQGCQPAGTWLHDVKTRYVDFLAGLKPAGWVSVLVVAAAPSAVTEVGVVSRPFGSYWYVKPSCNGPYPLEGFPGFRLVALADHLGTHGLHASVCSTSYVTGLKGLVARVQSAF